MSNYSILFEEKLAIFAALDGVRVFPPVERPPLGTWVGVGGSPRAHRGNRRPGSGGAVAGLLGALGASWFDLKYSAGTLGHELMLRSIELYGREVMPRVRELLVMRSK